jgi:Na+-translocating ferredoxin:NAD+ oxidoreductase RnfC subunit
MERLKIKQYDCYPEFYEGEISLTQVVIPLKQHLGAASLAIVKVGDRVKKGDLIGDVPEGALSAKVHASIDGIVTALGEAVTIMSSEKNQGA